MQENSPVDKKILALVQAYDLEGRGFSSPEIEELLGDVPRTTVNRYLAKMTKDDVLRKKGTGRDTRYVLNAPKFTLSADAKAVQKSIISQRNTTSIGYNDAFHLDYEPGSNALLGAELATRLHEKSKCVPAGRQPAGTLLRFILKPLLIGMSWSSAKLEGVRYSVADTRKLFEDLEKNLPGKPLSPSAQMLLNHKHAIELLIESAPYYGLNFGLVSQVHKMLMQNLLSDDNAPGAIRKTLVFIEGTNYTPEQSPHVLEQNLRAILDKASKISNPIESAFFLWTNIAYLQPFEDGNKRTSRLSCNIPMLIQNCLPLSFIGVKTEDYNEAMLGVYEKNDLTIARELFSWAYMKSCEHYEALLQVTPQTPSVAKRFSEQIRMAVRDTVAFNVSPDESLVTQLEAIDESLITESEKQELFVLVNQALETLDPMQATYYGVGREKISNWLNEGGGTDKTKNRMK